MKKETTESPHKPNPRILQFNESQTPQEREICAVLSKIITAALPEAENKIWHRHPVWFLDGNPIVGYNKLKAGIRLMFWSGASFDEEKLKPGTGKFKDASILYTALDQIQEEDVNRWITKSRGIQWDYKNIYKRKGKLERLK
ncbi:MAG: DUF1801 domain-containing protein [Bacteroidota bacterium]